MARPLQVPAVFGALFGGIWFILHDQIFCPHGNKNYMGVVLASTIQGAIMAGMLLSPYAISKGALAGFFFAHIKLAIERKVHPGGVVVNLPNFDE